MFLRNLAKKNSIAANQIEGEEGEIIDLQSRFPACDDTEELLVSLQYKPIPMTLELRKRRYEEQLRKRYNLAKEKNCTLL